MDEQPPSPKRRFGLPNFRKLFFRGLGIMLPSVLTLALLLLAYQYLSVYVAQPINALLREAVVQFSDYPNVSRVEVEQMQDRLTPAQREIWEERNRDPSWLETSARRHKLEKRWERWGVSLDLIGLVIAGVLIYFLGTMVGWIIGQRIARKTEEFFRWVPLIKQVYPAVKQITEFVLGGESAEKMHFSRVVAVEWPRKGLWGLGLVTGDTMKTIEDHSGTTCLTVFIPNSPTPFTGFVVTIPKQDTIDLPISIEEALKFVVSGGVVLPPIESRAQAQEIPTVILPESSGGPGGESGHLRQEQAHAGQNPPNDLESSQSNPTASEPGQTPGAGNAGDETTSAEGQSTTSQGDSSVSGPILGPEAQRSSQG